MRTTTLVLAFVLGIPCCLAQETAESAPAKKAHEQPNKFHFWMEVKLEESQNIFTAMTTADFEAIAKSADTLKTLNRVEGFVRRKNPKYRTQLKSFEFAVREIEHQAKRENIEGVVLGFNQLTLSCVNCHKQLRDIKTEANDTPPVR